MIYAGIARSDSERNQALRLAAASFPMPQDHNEDSATLRKRLLLQEHPRFKEDSAVVVCASDGSVVGSAFLIDCKLPFKRTILRGVFISSVSVAEHLRGRGVSHQLMDAIIESSRMRGVDIAMLISSKAVDGYYTRFGFWGLSQYSKATLEFATLSSGKQSAQSTKLTPVTTRNFGTCAALHTGNYNQLFGHCVREPEMWKYILYKTKYIGMRFDLVSIAGKTVGYAIHDGKGNLYEIATVAEDFSCNSYAFLRACAPNVEGVTLHVHPTHPFLKKLEGADVTLALRECPYGGHMVRVLNPAAFPGGEVHHGKSILGFTETSRLISMARITCFDSTKDIGLHSSFNIPLLDQI
jgi:predicted acetyltransferase